MMKRVALVTGLVLLGAVLVPASASAHHHPGQPSWQVMSTGTASRLRGLDVVNRKVVWATGSLGTVVRTVDSGQSWQVVSPPEAAGFRLRDIEAADQNTAVVLSTGGLDLARIYRTTDGGAHWTETFRNLDPAAFYDCMAFFDRWHGIALSDPVDGKFRILSTSDGGRSWQVLPNAGMPAALPGEFAFAQSGQCITVTGRDAWIGTAGGATARVLHSRDRGLTWTVVDTPMASNANAGVFGLAFRDSRRGVAVGGDLLNQATAVHALATSRDRGRTWTEPSAAPAGFRSGVAWHPRFHSMVLAVGPTGSDVSFDSGAHWRPFDTGSFDTVNCDDHGNCWAAGDAGRVATLRLG